MKGRLIVIEGLDGSGKSTQENLLKTKLANLGIKVNFIKLPNYDDPACELVKMYLAGRFGDKPSDVNAYAASTFFAVDRYVSYNCYWKEKYLNGEIFLADRYTTSNACHQMTKLDESMWEKCFADTLSLKRYNVKAEFSNNVEITEEQREPLFACSPDRMFWVRGCGYPFEITLSWERPMKVEGLKYMPGQFHRSHVGDICNYEIDALIGSQWINVAKDSCATSFDLKYMPFSVSIETTKVRLKILSGFGKDKYYSWYEDSEGWKYEVTDFKDKDVVIGALGLVVLDDSWQDMTDNEITYKETKTITVEIDD